jgi:hypothetical protein
MPVRKPSNSHENVNNNRAQETYLFPSAIFLPALKGLVNRALVDDASAKGTRIEMNLNSIVQAVLGIPLLDIVL